MRLAHDPVMRMLLNNFTDQEHETERRCRWTPATNITEDKDAFHLEMAVPGFNKKDFKIKLENNQLTISSEHQEKKKNDEENYMRREFSYQSFQRTFNLSENLVDGDKISAKYGDGVLCITLPKKEEAKPKPAKTIKVS